MPRGPGTAARRMRSLLGEMMAHEFGDQFAEYTHRVGRLLPKLHWPDA